MKATTLTAEEGAELHKQTPQRVKRRGGGELCAIEEDGRYMPLNIFFPSTEAWLSDLHKNKDKYDLGKQYTLHKTCPVFTVEEKKVRCVIREGR